MKVVCNVICKSEGWGSCGGGGCQRLVTSYVSGNWSEFSVIQDSNATSNKGHGVCGGANKAGQYFIMCLNNFT